MKVKKGKNNVSFKTPLQRESPSAATGNDTEHGYLETGHTLPQSISYT